MGSNFVSRTGLKALAACVLYSAAIVAATASATDLIAARDKGDRAALDTLIKQLTSAAQAGKPEANYQLALAYSYAAEVAIEQKDKGQSQRMAEAGLDAAKKAVAADEKNAEYHRLVGALCGQVIPANPLMGALKYGSCARGEISKALELDPKNALAYVSRGVGNYYLPASMGGGTAAAITDFDKAIALDPKLSDAYLWKGITLRKDHRNADARATLEKAVQLSPNRVWAKEQLEKTPAQ